MVCVYIVGVSHESTGANGGQPEIYKYMKGERTLIINHRRHYRLDGRSEDCGCYPEWRNYVICEA